MMVRLALFLCASTACFAQNTGTIRGTVNLDPSGQPMHGVHITLSPGGKVADSSDDGRFEFRDVAPGNYELNARSAGLFDDRKTIQITAGEAKTVDFRMRLAPVRDTVTVTASGHEEATLDAIQSVVGLDRTQLSLKSAASVGEALEGEAGVAKRSSGPGSSRPVVRGFDGDRVLILEDGIRTGSLSSQSGDHGEPIDVTKLERLEVVRGPATLLYGSNAIGGVVNAISRHDEFHQGAHQGVRGFITGLGGTNNGLGGGSAGFEFGTKAWEFWGSGGGQRTGDYHTPIGEIENSQTRMSQTSAGIGRYSEKSFFSFNYGFTDSRYGVPVNLAADDPEFSVILMRRHSFRLNGGLKDVGPLDDIQSTLSYTDYNHQEIVGGDPETRLFNKQFVYRGVANQKKRGLWSGSFGIWGMQRDYKAEGEETLAPPTNQSSFAAFALENLDFKSFRVQFGGRLERNAYSPVGLQDRSFTGFSGAIGLSKRLWKDGAFVANYSHSYRAPALEELYNFGPHPGNLTFEIGNPNLNSERNDGVDFSVRHQGTKIHGEANFFYYRIKDFVYLAPTGRILGNLIEADYLQRDSRFVGGEAKLDLQLHSNLWLNLGADTVNARLLATKTFLPRIPPLRGRVGFDARVKGLSVKPELVLSAAQNKIFETETRTAGYAVMNLTASYTIVRTHQIHFLSAELFNAGDQLYRNHLSFIKDFAPEIGRGVRFSYTMQFF